ncbi:CoA transferase [Bosea thiooxidans]
MHPLLADLRVVEASSFVAAPSCGLHLAQLGATVIRLDMIGGGPDFRRWPKSEDGSSFFWEGLNKGKKSVAIDLRQPQGRELAARIIAAPGQGAGLFVTNFPVSGFLAHERLAAHRPDLITVRIMGHASGRQAVDYTVNNAVGLPSMTGPASLGAEPVNHVLPAWDLLAGSHATFSLLAAERHRQATGEGQEIRLPLFDLAASTVGHLGQIAEATVQQSGRERHGNALYGAFGRDFLTADGERVMIVAITEGQWSSLVRALGIEARIEQIEGKLGVSFRIDEGNRFIHRDELFALVEVEIGARSYADLTRDFDELGVCWSLYRDLKEALDEDPEFSGENPIFSNIEHPSGLTYLTPGSATAFSGLKRREPVRAPRLGEHTEEVLSNVLGLTGGEIAKLHDLGTVASA